MGKTLNCKLCEEMLEGYSLASSKGVICKECANDFGIAEMQPIMLQSDVLWCMAQTFFLKGKGEEVTFKETWNKYYGDHNLIDIDDIIPKQK